MAKTLLDQSNILSLMIIPSARSGAAETVLIKAVGYVHHIHERLVVTIAQRDTHQNRAKP